MLHVMALPQDNIEKYRRYVDGFALTDDQKAELVRTVWRIIESFVDRAFGVDAVQQIMCPPSATDADAQADMIPSDTTVITPCRLADAFRIMSGGNRGRKI